jgi:hypothetical protein
MEPEVVKKKVLESTGTVGWGMIGLGNVILIFFLIIGMQGTAILADLIWCITLDIGAIVLYFTQDERFKKVVKI